jgi:hypothetical protein
LQRGTAEAPEETGGMGHKKRAFGVDVSPIDFAPVYGWTRWPRRASRSRFLKAVAWPTAALFAVIIIAAVVQLISVIVHPIEN